MSSAPVAALLLLNAILFLVFLFSDRENEHGNDFLLLSVLFFVSGMPALIYQVVWQRALFAIYGVNAQSVAVVVTAFMLGLGIGSLVGGWLSARFPRHGMLLFGIAELGVAVFGLSSLQIFRWVARDTAGAGLGAVILLSLALLLLPTMLMGATLPLLVEHLVSQTRRVGMSLSILYFVNTFGSAVACYLCATSLLRDFAQSGAVTIAACGNVVVGATAYLYARSAKEHPTVLQQEPTPSAATPLPLTTAILLAGL